MLKKLLNFILLLTFFLGLAADQATKIGVENQLMTYQDERDLTLYKGKKVSVLDVGAIEDSFYISVKLNYVRNLGAIWGSWASLQQGVKIPLFYVTILVVILGVFYFLRKLPQERYLTKGILVLVLSGAVGNFIDRVRLGYVIDWIDVRWSIMGWYVRFPNFNLADVLIIIGILLLVGEHMVQDFKSNKHKEAK